MAFRPSAILIIMYTTHLIIQNEGTFAERGSKSKPPRNKRSSGIDIPEVPGTGSTNVSDTGADSFDGLPDVGSQGANLTSTGSPGVSLSVQRTSGLGSGNPGVSVSPAEGPGQLATGSTTKSTASVPKGGFTILLGIVTLNTLALR